ncbi:hypothetical protein [Elstera sp.]|jgi:hypothetical protein|uniref:hypothetical protein n=1 Tax=Elstera sp. TaxID=1916664 RepID=UPI0037C05D42
MSFWHFLGFLALSTCFFSVLSEMKGPSAAQMVGQTIRLNPDTLQDRCTEAGCALAFRQVASARPQDYIR